eukprot:10782201-Lingulodinium_polyedra.AAC.1
MPTGKAPRKEGKQGKKKRTARTKAKRRWTAQAATPRKPPTCMLAVRAAASALAQTAGNTTAQDVARQLQGGPLTEED